MVAVAACLLACSVPDPLGLAGEYEGAGTDVAGRPYHTRVVIKPDGDAYRVQTTNPDGQELAGIGLLTGRHLSVSWTGRATEGKVFVGLTVYTVAADGSLVGRWTLFGARGVVRTETLRPAA